MDVEIANLAGAPTALFSAKIENAELPAGDAVDRVDGDSTRAIRDRAPRIYRNIHASYTAK
ncbi:hypothetical protein [Arthrobacter sp. UYCu712]|uniref:hypothetical protein n=1 Tax=Arthrobacter sp. UYCu712 TaxID=3156340 RepID=UPI00339A6C9F